VSTGQRRVRGVETEQRDRVEGVLVLRAVRDVQGRVSDFRHIQVDAGAADLLGRSASELESSALLDPADPISHERFAAYRRLLLTREAISGDLVVRAAGGSERRLSHEASASGDHILVTLREVRGAPSEAPQLDDAPFLLLGSLPDAVLAYTPDGLLSWANPAAEVLFDLPGEELRNQPLDKVIASRGGASLLEPAHLVPGIHEVLGRRADGTTFPARLAVARLLDRGRVLLGATVQDISEQKRAEREYRLREEALRQLADEQSQLHVAQAALSHEQATLRRIATLVASTTDPDVVMHGVAGEIARLVGADVGLVVRFDGERGTVAGLHGDDILPVGLVGAATPLRGDGVLARVAERDGPVRGELLELVVEDSLRMLEVAAVGAPVRLGGRAWGAVVAASKRRDTFPRESEPRLARAAELVGVAISNAEAWQALSRQAATDPLTGLANHRTFHEQLRLEVTRARRYDRPLALVLLDLDHFKQINDTYGHAAGDQVIQEIARRLRGQARDAELVARIGGEEFAWLLPESDDEGARSAAERVRQVVIAQPFAAAGRLTISAGVADLAHAGSPEQLFQLADAALYAAKSRGRNNVIRASEVGSRPRPQPRIDRFNALAGLRALARAVDAKDPSTQRHSERVAELASRLAQVRGWPPSRCEQLRESGLVHDVGKIGVPDAVLYKSGGLTSDERAQIMLHAALGAAIVSEVLSLEQVRWIRHHHERFDGRGYPDGLAAADIDEGSRLLALADAWDAMTVARHYAPRIPPAEAIELCSKLAGTQFAPEAVEALRTLWDAGELRDELV
jgi:diguanylate cyclase (GGDEF)-like protein/PAS domain S-box-containing protein